MNVKINKIEFLRGLRLAQSIADRKSTMPMLANVLLRTVGADKMLVVATDLNVSISAELPSENKKEGGITVAAKALHDIVSNMPGASIEFDKVENNWAEIRSGTVKYRLVGMPDRDFPKIPDHEKVEFLDVEASVFREMIDKTLFSVSNDETRFHLNGVLFESDGERARMVSTDGHRLSKVERTLPGTPKLSAGVIIPKKGLVELKRALEGLQGACKLAVKDPYIYVSANGLVLAIKLIESQFPPYDAVIPKSNDKVIQLERSALLDALKRAQLMSSDTRGVRFTLAGGSLVITSDNPDVGEVREEIATDYTGADLCIGFNGKYVLDLLGQIPQERVTLSLAGELDPVLVRPQSDEDYLGVVMPMRI